LDAKTNHKNKRRRGCCILAVSQTQRTLIGGTKNGKTKEAENGKSSGSHSVSTDRRRRDESDRIVAAMLSD